MHINHNKNNNYYYYIYIYIKRERERERELPRACDMRASPIGSTCGASAAPLAAYSIMYYNIIEL